MPNLIFQADDVRRIVEHSLAAPVQAKVMTGYDAKAQALITELPKAPAVLLVHDEGVYLMSNGMPRDIRVPGKPGAFVAYAKHCNPKTDDDYYDNARGLVGGDDFGEHFEWAEAMKKMLDDGASAIVINFTARACSLSAIYPGGKRPAATVPNTARDEARRFARMMRTKVLAQKPSGDISIFKNPPTPAIINQIKTKFPDLKILNGLPAPALLAAAEAFQARAR